MSQSKTYIVRRSTRKDKKFMVVLPNGHLVHFGARGYEDYTVHKDKARRNRYMIRHHSAENWSKKGIGSPGFWAYYLLWNKPTLLGSARAIQKKFNVVVKLQL